MKNLKNIRKKVAIRSFLKKYWRSLVIASIGIGLATSLYLYKLGSLVGGISPAEQVTSRIPVGWHGIYDNPFYLPIKLLRSIAYLVFEAPGQTAIRLPSVAFGLITVGAFVLLVKKWHGPRIAILAGLLFATSSWVLHVSRYVSTDIMYLAALPLLLMSQAYIHKARRSGRAIYLAVLVWGLLLYVPGLVWFIGLAAFWERRNIAAGWQRHALWWQKSILALISLWWLPLLAIHLSRSTDFTRQWLGAPTSFAPIGRVARAIAAVPYQLLAQGPSSDPAIWLIRLPILDIGALALFIVGVYFYLRHFRATRTHILVSYGVLGFILIGIGGAVALSLLVPLLYIAAAAGIAVLLSDWFKIFPVNPLARNFGVALIGLLVLSSAYYNLDRYFVAWANNQTTQTIFRQKP